MRPPSGAISPASCPISVVLPAPLGPMMACSSPSGTASEIASEAMTPPKRLLSPSIRNSASGTAGLPQQAVDAAPREQHDQQKQRTQQDLPVFPHAYRRIPEQRGGDRPDCDRQRLLQCQQHDGAEQRSE